MICQYLILFYLASVCSKNYCMVFDKMIFGIVIGLVGIVVLLVLIPLPPLQKVSMLF